MAIIVPSILEDNINSFDKRLAAILAIPEVQRIQIDFSDGKFTPRKTVELAELDSLSPAYFWEGHFMVENPDSYFFDAKVAGFSAFILHFEAISDKTKIKSYVEELQKYKMSAGLAINPETEIQEVFPYLDLFGQILVLGVKPGYQGQEISSTAPQRIKTLKNRKKNVKIEIDGGVKLSNARELLLAGAEMFVVGSALFDPGDKGQNTPSQNFEKFQKETQNL